MPQPAAGNAADPLPIRYRMLQLKERAGPLRQRHTVTAVGAQWRAKRRSRGPQGERTKEDAAGPRGQQDEQRLVGRHRKRNRRAGECLRSELGRVIGGDPGRVQR